MEITSEKLLMIIGTLYVELMLLRQELEKMRTDKDKEAV